MITITRLRMLRLRYHIPMTDLEEKTGISNQNLSRIELGYVKPNENQEELVNLAFCEIIAERRTQLVGMERDYMLCKNHLLDPLEVKSDEL